MLIKQQFIEDMKVVMCGGDKYKLGVVWLMFVVIKQCEVDECVELDEVQVLVVLEKMFKQCKDLISQYVVVGCEDLVEVECVEIMVIEIYLFSKFFDVEFDVLIEVVIIEIGVSFVCDMGKVVGVVKVKVGGCVDMGVVLVCIKVCLVG